MELQIRYCTTSDGVSIAWGEMGQGPAALYFQPAPFSHVERVVAISQALWNDLATSFRLIMFDVRGTGMSERDVDHVSGETLLIDAEAVVSAAQLDQFLIYADFPLLAQHPALQLATAVPSRVTHLILESPFQNMSEDEAGGGEILVPEAVRHVLAGKGFVFGDRGEFVPKGFDEGVRVWEVRWGEKGSPQEAEQGA